MTSFLSLPPQVRIRIYNHVLALDLDPSPSVDDLYSHEANQRIQRVFRHGSSADEIAIERIIRYPFSIYLPFAGLLRSNRTVRQEFRDALQNEKRRRTNYKLDLAIDGELFVLPTWLRCPVRSMEIHKLEIDVRLLGFAKEDVLDDFGGLQQHGRDRCRTLAFAIVALVARFVERGPRWEHLRQGEIKVNSLILNFRSRWEDLEPHLHALGRANSIEEERGLMEHLNLSSTPHTHDQHDTTVRSGKADSVIERDPSEVVDANDLLRTVDLVLRPLCREERFALVKRKSHFSAGHLAFLRRNVRKIHLMVDGRLEKSFSVSMDG